MEAMRVHAPGLRACWHWRLSAVGSKVCAVLVAQNQAMEAIMSRAGELARNRGAASGRLNDGGLWCSEITTLKMEGDVYKPDHDWYLDQWAYNRGKCSSRIDTEYRDSYSNG